MDIKNSFLCSVILTILLTVDASSYLPCNSAETCKAQMSEAFSFEYVQELNRFTREKLRIIMDAGSESRIDFVYNQTKLQKINDLLQVVQDEIIVLGGPNYSSLQNSQASFEKADCFWKRLFNMIGETENLRFYEHLMEAKVAFLNSILRIWRESNKLMLVKSENDAKEINEITKELIEFDPILSFRGTEERMAELIVRIFKFINIKI